MKLDYKLLMYLVVVCAFFFVVGYMIGSYTTIKLVADIASRFIDVDDDLIENALTRYKQDMKQYYSIKIQNASIFYEQGNQSKQGPIC